MNLFSVGLLSYFFGAALMLGGLLYEKLVNDVELFRWPIACLLYGGLLLAIGSGIVASQTSKGAPADSSNLAIGAQYQVLASHGGYFIVRGADEKAASKLFFIERKGNQTIPPQFIVEAGGRLVEVSPSAAGNAGGAQ